MKYLFILGRNIELSKLEVISYLNRMDINILNQKLIQNALLIETNSSLPEKTIDKLGGTLSIGEILCKIKDLEKTTIYFGKENNITYAIWNFSEKYKEVEKYLKKRFKEEKLKASLKHLRDKIDSQNGKKIPIPSSKTIDCEYFIFEEYFGKVIHKCDYESIEKRDIEKPVRRESLAISPRLAKILINLSEIEDEQILLDPFCGVATILQEALIQNINVIGIDKDKKAIEGAKENLNWFKFNKENYTLINEDSTKAKINRAGAIATEPDLGEILKKTPTKEEAKKTLKNFEKLMIKVINNFNKDVTGRIVFTSPYIRIGKKRLECNIENLLTNTKYKLIEKIPEFRKNQIVGRMIYVLTPR